MTSSSSVLTSMMDTSSQTLLTKSISFIDTQPGGFEFEQSLRADHKFVDTFGSFTDSMNVILKSAQTAGERSMKAFLSGRFSEHVLVPPVREIESIKSPRSILRRRLSDQIQAFGHRDGFFQDSDGDDEDDDSWDSEDDKDFFGSVGENKKSTKMPSRELNRVSSRRQNVLSSSTSSVLNENEEEQQEEETDEESETSHPVQRLNKFTADALKLTDEERKEMISAMRDKLETRKDLLHGEWDDSGDVSSESQWTESDYEEESY